MGKKSVLGSANRTEQGLIAGKEGLLGEVRKQVELELGERERGTSTVGEQTGSLLLCKEFVLNLISTGAIEEFGIYCSFGYQV